LSLGRKIKILSLRNLKPKPLVDSCLS
jgi:hypothetical protein